MYKIVVKEDICNKTGNIINNTYILVLDKPFNIIIIKSIIIF
jgi:hypothetical protein